MTKKIVFIILLLSVLGGFAQKSVYFKVDPSENIVFLYPMKGMVQPAALKPPYDLPVSLKQKRQSVHDIQALLKEKFPGVSDEDFKTLRKVIYKVYFSGEGKVLYYTITFPSRSNDLLSRFEKQMYEVAEVLSAWDFSRYGLNIPYKNDISNQFGIIAFPLQWLKTDWKDNE